MTPSFRKTFQTSCPTSKTWDISFILTNILEISVVLPIFNLPGSSDLTLLFKEDFWHLDQNNVYITALPWDYNSAFFIPYQL